MFITAISGLSLYLGGWLGLKIRRGRADGLIIAILRERLNYLKLDEEGMIVFATDFAIEWPERVAYLSNWGWLLREIYDKINIFELAPKTTSTRKIKDSIATQYLLSSDFFLNGADESITVKYITYYDPYKTICENPFARLRIR